MRAAKGLGTDDSMMIDVTILYSDYFKGDLIKKPYEELKYGNVEEMFKKELSGNYMKCVQAMWGVEVSK